jgi:hypothetical protein
MNTIADELVSIQTGSRVCFPFRLDHAFWDTACRGRSSWSLDA